MGDFSFDGLFLIVWYSFFKLPVWGFSLSEHSQRIQGIVPGNRVAGECRPGGLEIQNRNTHTHAVRQRRLNRRAGQVPLWNRCGRSLWPKDY